MSSHVHILSSSGRSKIYLFFDSYAHAFACDLSSACASQPTLEPEHNLFGWRTHRSPVLLLDKTFALHVAAFTLPAPNFFLPPSDLFAQPPARLAGAFLLSRTPSLSRTTSPCDFLCRRSCHLRDLLDYRPLPRHFFVLRAANQNSSYNLS